MKKIFLSFIILSLFGTIYAQKNIGDFKTINVREKIHNGNYQLIGKGDSSGQFYYRNMQNPERPLDGVNLRTLRAYYNTFFDTIVVFAGDTVIIPAPDTFRIVTIDTSYWLHTGESFTIPAYVDTFYNSYFNNWIGNNDAIYFPPADTTYSMFDKKWKGLNDTIKADSVIYIRPRPGCTGCWDYHNVGSNTWHQWFCTENDKPNLQSTPMTDSLLLIDWFTEFPNQGIITSGYYLGFVVDTSNYNKVLYMSSDSVVKWISPDSLFSMDEKEVLTKWRDSTQWISIDSLLNDTLFFSEFENKWKLRRDTVEKQKDSIYFIDKWYPINGDTLRKVPFLDSIYFANTFLQNKDTIPDMRDSLYDDSQNKYVKNNDTITSSRWNLDLYGINRLSNIGVGSSSKHYSKIYAYSNEGIAVDGHSDYSYGGYFSSDSVVGVYALCLPSYAAAFRSNYIPIKTDGGTWSIESVSSDNGIDITLNNTSIGNFLRLTRGTEKLSIDYNGTLRTAGKIDSDSLQVGSGSTISRTGTMATYDFWTGTQAEWTANTPHNGIYPQASTTFWTIKD